MFCSVLCSVRKFFLVFCSVLCSAEQNRTEQICRICSVFFHPCSPARVGVAVTDLFTGVLTASAILAAQVDVLQGNGGSWIQSSLFHSQSAMLSHIAANYLTAGMDGKRYGTAHPSLVPYQSFMTADGKYLTIGAGNNNHFKQLCQLINLKESDTFIWIFQN